jgi:hypothetical protein
VEDSTLGLRSRCQFVVDRPVVAAVAVAGLLGSVGHVAVGHGGFGWLIPVFIVFVVVRRIAGHR